MQPLRDRFTVLVQIQVNVRAEIQEDKDMWACGAARLSKSFDKFIRWPHFQIFTWEVNGEAFFSECLDQHYINM